MNGDRQGHGLRSATTLEETNDQLLPLAFERQTQRRWRRLAGTGRRTKDEEQRTTALGSKLQTTKRVGLHLRQPGDNGADAIGSERALAGPDGIATGSTGDQQTRQIKTVCMQCRRMQWLR